MSAALIASTLLVSAPIANASEATEKALSETQNRVEETARAYDEVVGQIEMIENQISVNQNHLESIQRDLPAQRAASNSSLVALYKMSQEGVDLINLLLGSGDITEFLENLDYINRIQEQNAGQVRKLSQMESELSATQVQLETARTDLENQRVVAEDALTKAQEARAAAQAAAEAQKKKEAAALAAGNIPKNTSSSGANTGSTATGGAGEPVGAGASSDGVNWSTDRATFVKEWTTRIDNYLEGSPLSGYGNCFAAAAWEHGVDPRWSPAISCIESSKGAICFRNHNAWGWGSVDWDTWEEAINDHVAGLARGYGYTITIEGAQKYCPPNWEFWYNNVSAQMDLI